MRSYDSVLNLNRSGSQVNCCSIFPRMNGCVKTRQGHCEQREATHGDSAVEACFGTWGINRLPRRLRLLAMTKKVVIASNAKTSITRNRMRMVSGNSVFKLFHPGDRRRVQRDPRPMSNRTVSVAVWLPIRRDGANAGRPGQAAWRCDWRLPPVGFSSRRTYDGKFRCGSDLSQRMCQCVTVTWTWLQ